MKLYQMYFSPTGGTKKIAQMIGNVWNCEKKEIDLLNPEDQKLNYSFTPEDICIVAVPSFGGRVPEPALNRFRKMHGGGARVVLAAVYGNRDFEDTLVELSDTLESAGFVSFAAIAAVAEHSIVHKFGEGRPDKEDEKELECFAIQIREYLENNSNKEELHIPGNRPYREYSGVPLKPEANKDCTKCGKCVNQCPAHAIPEENPASVDKEKCISCMHCISICPQKARSNNKLILLAASQKMKKSCSSRKENKLFLSNTKM